MIINMSMENGGQDFRDFLFPMIESSVFDIMSGYETLKSHVLIQLVDGLGFINRNASKEQGIDVHSHPTMGEKKVTRKPTIANIQGATSKQNDESTKGLEPVDLQGDISRQRKFLNEEKDGLLESKKERRRIIEDNPQGENQCHDQVPDFIYLKVSELIQMKDTIEEYYRNGIFEETVGSDITKLLSVMLQNSSPVAT